MNFFHIPLQADVCVNSAPRTLDLTRGTISLSFFRAGGQELQRKCDEYVQFNGPLHYGDIAVTDSPSLASLGCRYVIHTVGRAYDGTGGSAEQASMHVLYVCIRTYIYVLRNNCVQWIYVYTYVCNWYVYPGIHIDDL